MFLGAKSIVTDATDTLGARMAGVWGKKGAYGAHIFNIVGVVTFRNNPLHMLKEKTNFNLHTSSCKSRSRPGSPFPIYIFSQTSKDCDEIGMILNEIL